jgi:4-hydroxy-tetrahydrodipicolinate reductase
MGRALVQAAHADARFKIVGATERPGGPGLGQDAGLLAGLPSTVGVIAVDAVAAAMATADVWIDFTTPAATRAALAALPASPVKAAIIGSTGLSAEDEALIAEAAQRIVVVKSGNFSLGVTLLAALVRQAASRLGEGWDIEILEAHHRRKIDAPSGTALLLGEAAAEGRGVELKDKRLPPRDGETGPRPEGGIGFAVVRGGGIVGDHEVLFCAEGETLRLSHHAADRGLFARGALTAAAWAVGREPGLYDMGDVLNV